METRFSSQTLAEIFRDIYLSERTGVLTLAGDEGQQEIYFNRGLIDFANSDRPEQDLGARLVSAGRLSAGALDEAMSGVEQATDLPGVLLNRGLIGRAELLETIKESIDGVVRAAFACESGTARLEEGEPLQGLFESDVLHTFQVILNGIFSMHQFDPIREAMQGLDNRLKVRSPSPIPLERLTLSPSHGFILSRVDGTTAVKDVLSTLPQSEGDLALRFLFGMMLMGVLEYDPPLAEGTFKVANILRDHEDRRALERMQEQTIQQAYGLMRKQTPYEILAVTPSASRQAIERAYEEAKALFSRDRILPRVREKFRSELAVIESRLIEAFLTLTQPDRRQRAPELQPAAVGAAGGRIKADDLLVRVEMDKAKSQLALEEASRVAEGYYNKARQAVREGDFHNAIQYAKLAISYNDKDPRLYFLLADCQVRNPGARWQHNAEQNYTRATELDAWNVEYWMTLGRFYKKRGLKLRARKQFEEALKLNPTHDAATQELESL